MKQNKKNIFYTVLNHPGIFDIFLKLFGDRKIHKKVIKGELNIQKKNRVLDIGCGTGDLALMFPAESYTGIDCDKNYVDFARKKYSRNFLTMNAADLKFADDYFDIILVSGLFHHIPDETLQRVLLEIKRVIKPSGRALFFEVTYLNRGDSIFKELIRKADRGKYIREYGMLQKAARDKFDIEKCYIKKSMWADYSVLVVSSRTK